jgi:arylsulfatase A-like enzyme
MSSIALVVFDSLRKDSFDARFDWLPGIHFDNAWSTSGWTVPAHGTLFTGLYPTESGVFAKAEALTSERPVLAEALSKTGYTTRGFSANANISEVFDFTRGFDEFRHSWRGQRRDDEVLDWGRFISKTRDKGAIRYVSAIKECLQPDINTRKSLKIGVQMKARDLGISSIAGKDDGAASALDLVQRTDFSGDEFFFMNLMEAHGPYDPPDEYRTVDIDAQASFEDTMFDGPNVPADELKQAYDDCVRYLSDIYQEIFAELTEHFDYIITVSDHGEMFGRDGLWDHNYGIYPELTHVPIHIYDGRDTIEHVDRTVSLLDIYPTILELADIEGADSRGRNLLTDHSSEQYLVERHGLRSSRVEGLRDNGYSTEFIERWDQPFYGVVSADGRYVWQARDRLKSDDKTDFDAARTEIEGLIADLNEVDVTVTDDRDVPDDVRDRLNELGYASN